MSACASKADSQLVQLSQAADPDAFAAQTGLSYVNGMVRVIIELADVAVLPTDPAVQVEAQYQNMVQAKVSPTDICAIANQPEIKYIGLAVAPQPQ